MNQRHPLPFATRSPLIAGLFAVALVFAGCRSSGVSDTPPAAPEPAHQAFVASSLEPFECGTIQKLHTFGGVFLASQPQAADLEQARLGGVVTVVDLRRPDEDRGFDEASVAASLGLRYLNPAFRNAGELTDEVLDETRRILREEARPMLLHCSSSNRTGAVWLAHRVLDGGLPWDAALEEARTVGLTTEALAERVRAYVEARTE